MATTLTSLPGTPKFVDMLLTDHMKREEDPEAYDACRAYLVQFMAEVDACEPESEPESLGWYSPYMVGFIDGFNKARQEQAYKGLQNAAPLSHE